jgi:pimeloyl-ACP methyl ester carboxylesterase
VRLLDEVVTRLGIYRFALAGRSMGGNTAWHYAIEHPDRLNALILVGASGYPDDEDEAEEDDGPLVFRLLSTQLGRAVLQKFDPSLLVRQGLQASFAD